jgi:hypothetical protein
VLFLPVFWAAQQKTERIENINKGKQKDQEKKIHKEENTENNQIRTNQ